MAMLTVLKLDFCQSNYCYLIFTTVLPTPRETLTGLPEKTTYLRYRPSPPGVTNGAYKLCKRYLYSCEFNQHLQNYVRSKNLMQRCLTSLSGLNFMQVRLLQLQDLSLLTFQQYHRLLPMRREVLHLTTPKRTYLTYSMETSIKSRSNRPYSYSQKWTGTCLQWRLIRGNILKIICI